MKLFPWLFAMAPREDGEGGGGQGDSTTDDFSNPEGDDAAAEEGAAELDARESEEQDEESQDLEEQEEGEEEEPLPASISAKSFKDKHGNFDWKKINRATGGGDLEKSFKESQATITRFSQENKELKERAQHLPQLQQRAKLADDLDQQYRSNPRFRQAVNQALGLAPDGQAAGPALPEGVNPKDPLAPLIQQLMQQQQQVLGWRQQEQQRQQQEQQRNVFLQGLVGAKSAFKEQLGRDPTEAEMTVVANKMRESGYLNGAEFVPALFNKEIREAATAALQASRSSKRNLPARGKNGVRPPQETQKKGRRLRDSFDEAWSETMDS